MALKGQVCVHEIQSVNRYFLVKNLPKCQGASQLKSTIYNINHVNGAQGMLLQTLVKDHSTVRCTFYFFNSEMVPGTSLKVRAFS